MDASVHIRDATPDDFERINTIYNWTIIDNHVSFEEEPWDLAKRRAWWEARPDGLDVLVAEWEGEVVGVTYSSFYRPKDDGRPRHRPPGARYRYPAAGSADRAAPRARLPQGNCHHCAAQ
jgi:hypothetical protein